MMRRADNRRRRVRVPREEVAPPEAVAFAPAELLGGPQRMGRFRTAIVAGLTLHAFLTVLAFLGDREHKPDRVPPPPAIPIVVERLAPPPPVTPPTAPPVHPRPRAPAARHSPPPAAAQAARVVAAAPEAPLDFTGATMPMGTSKSYAGGFTANAGTSATAVSNSGARPEGVPGGTGSAGSLARPPVPSREDWTCGWPDEAQSSDLRDARVALKVSTNPLGEVTRVDVLDSPSPAFAQAARFCARSETFRPAHDDAGHNVAGTTPAFLVHFVR